MPRVIASATGNGSSVPVPQESSDAVVREEFSTDDPEEAHAALSERYAQHEAVVDGSTDDFTFDLRGTRAGPLRLDRVRYSMRARGTTSPFGFLFFVRVDRGVQLLRSGREDLHVGPGESALYGVGRPVSGGWDDVELSTLSLPYELVARRAHELTGLPPADLRFEGFAPVSPAMTRYWRDTLGYVEGELRRADSALTSTLLQVETSNLLATAALSTFPNTAMRAGRLSGSAGVTSAGLRRAVAYLESHADQPITLTDIAHAAGVTPRALQHGFARHYGTTPTSYLRRVRLERAHAELQAADPTQGATVVEIALRWGFAKPGRFADYYRQQYGRLPSETLRS